MWEQEAHGEDGARALLGGGISVKGRTPVVDLLAGALAQAAGTRLLARCRIVEEGTDGSLGSWTCVFEPAISNLLVSMCAPEGLARPTPGPALTARCYSPS